MKHVRVANEPDSRWEPTGQRIQNLDYEKAHWILQQVSLWGGNNARAQKVFLPTCSRIACLAEEVARSGRLKRTAVEWTTAVEKKCGQLAAVHTVKFRIRFRAR
jgi:hypothetical protein